MQDIQRETKKISEVREHISDIGMQMFQNPKRIEVKLNRLPVFAIVSIDDLHRLEAIDEQTKDDLALLKSMREAFKDVPSEEIERETDRIIKELRERKNQQNEA